VAPREIVSGAFRRNSSALSFVVIVSFAVIIVSTTYNLLAFAPSDFLARPEAQEYENAVENIVVLDRWTRTLEYWSNNLGIAGAYAVTAPGNLGFNTGLYSDYSIGISFTYWYHQGGATELVSFSGSVFVHGLLEITGFYIIMAASMRLAWNFWKGMGHMMLLERSRGEFFRFSPRIPKWAKRELRRHRMAIKQHLTDFLVLVLVGAFLVFLAAPIESYVSPKVGAAFYSVPALGTTFLAVVGIWYAAVVAKGLGALRRDFKSIWGDVKLVSKKRWSPSQISFFMLAAFLLLTLFRLML